LQSGKRQTVAREPVIVGVARAEERGLRVHDFEHGDFAGLVAQEGELEAFLGKIE
jgi:hypothetical protein